MAITSASVKAGGVVNFSSGNFTSDNSDVTVNLGFVPRLIKVVNSTDVIVWEKLPGMAANAAIKTVTAGTTTIDATSQIVVGTSALGTQNTFLLKAALVGNLKAISWVAFG